MTQLWQFLILLTVHFIADFMLQTHWQASNKSKNNHALARHVGAYTIVLLFAVPFIFPDQDRGWVLFVGVNCVLHFVTDYCTSRLSSRLWAKQDWHNFFVVIGADQLIHQATLACTMVLCFGGSTP